MSIKAEQNQAIQAVQDRVQESEANKSGYHESRFESEYFSGLERSNGRHPAVTMPIPELIAALEDRISKGLVRRDVHGDLVLYNYTKACQYESAWDEVTLVARGLIIDVQRSEIVAMPFPKFFNYEELAGELPDEDFVVTEKADGIAGIVYHYNDTWHVSTRGRLSSEPSRMAQEYLRENIALETLDTEVTYLVEIISPEFRVTIDYQGLSELILIGGYHVRTGLDLPYNALQGTASEAGMPVAKAHDFESIAAVLEAVKALPADKEGFVIRYENGTRVKCKSEAYLNVQRTFSQVTPLKIWQMLRTEEDMEKFRRELPEEVLADFDAIYLSFENEYQQVLQRSRAHYDTILESLSNSNPDFTRKDVVESIQALDSSVSSLDKRLMLLMGPKESQATLRQIIYDSMRPKGNGLAGYEASTYGTRVK